MTRTVKAPQMGRIMTVITSMREQDAPARAHTRANALASDSDRIAAAVYAAMRLQRRISVASDLATVTQHGRRWEHYCDSRGTVNSICPEQVPS